MFSVTFYDSADLNGGASSAGFNLIGAQKTIGSPLPKTTTIPVPGSDVTLDFTEAFGGVHYNNRTITLVFLSLQPWSNQMAQDSTVKNALHGKKKYVVFSDDANYYYVGRVNVGDWEYYRGAGRITVTIDAEPYKLKKTDTVVYANAGGHKNLYQYYDSFEDRTNDDLYYRKVAAVTATVQSTTYAKSGSKVLSITTTEANTAVYIGHSSTSYGQVACGPGRYIFSYYARKYDTDVQLRCVVFGKKSRGNVWATGNFKILNSDTTTFSGNWYRIELPITVTREFPYVCVCFTLLTTGATAWIDCLQLEKVASNVTSASEWEAYSDVSGTATVTLTNSDRKPAIPYITASAAATLTWGGNSASISNVANVQVPQLSVEDQNVSVSVSSAGLVTFSYTEGSL